MKNISDRAIKHTPVPAYGRERIDWGPDSSEDCSAALLALVADKIEKCNQ